MSQSYTPGALGEGPSRLLGAERALELEVEREAVPGEHGHTDAGARDPQLGQAEDLAALVPEFCSSFVSALPSSTSLPATGMTLKAIGAGNFDGAGISTALPSWARAAAPSATFRTCSSSSAVPASPARRRPGRWRPRPGAGPPARGGASAPASQPWSCSSGWRRCPFGIADKASAFTSGTTRGTSGSIRQAEELSMTIAPAAATRGASSREVGRPA